MNLEIEFTKKQTAFDRAVDKFPYTLYGGAKGGGKSHGLRIIMLRRCLEQPGTVAYIFRKTFPELQRNHITPLFKQFPELKQFYNESKKQLRLGDSELNFAYVEHARDLPKFQGLDAPLIGIEEAGEWQFENFEYIDTQRRAAKAGTVPRMLLTGNPGGIGHQWLKRLFISKVFRGAEDPEAYHFVPARVEDNPFLMKNDPGYVKRLESISSEALRRAFRYGDWDIQAGQFFADFRREIHVVKPFKIPDHWKRYWSYDFGFGHPAAMTIAATDEDGNVFITEEYCKAQQHISSQAEWIKSRPYFKKLGAGLAGLDCWVNKFAPVIDKKQPDQGPTIADNFLSHGIYLEQAKVSRIQGANQIRDYLRYEEKELDGKQTRIGPRLYFFETCEQSIECITRMQHDPDDIEDVLKVDAESGDPYTGDDLYDSLRYLLMGRPSLSVTPKPMKKDQWRDAFKAQANPRGSWRTI